MTIQAGGALAVGPRKIVQRLGGSSEPEFTICVMLTDWLEYEICIKSFRSRGFDDDVCEFLVMDNSVFNRGDAYTALNEFLQSAKGEYIIICHQDVELLDAGRDELKAQILELNRIAPRWAVCGNSGMADDSWPIVRLQHPNELRAGGSLPARAVSLDENFLLVKRCANLALSADLTGFHHYGTDICIIADVLGWEAYVIEFLLLHKSHGNFDERWRASMLSLENKYTKVFRRRWVHLVNGHSFLLGATPMKRLLARTSRFIGKAAGVVAKNRDHSDPAKRAARDRRRGSKGAN